MNIQEQIFLKIVDMSISGSFVVLAVLLIRPLFAKAPKVYPYILWIITGVRFLCPFLIPSVFSLVPVNSGAITYDRLAYTPAVDTGILRLDAVINKGISNVAPATSQSSVNPMQIYIALGSLLWLAVGLGLLSYGVISYRVMKGRLRTAVMYRAPYVYATDHIDTPVLLGFLSPKIYLPVGLGDKEAAYVIAHERMHRKRGDHFVKLLGFLAVVLHWFNPLAWVFFYMLCKDMEMSCDEKVLSNEAEDIRIGYSETLLALAMRRSRLFSLSPLAFGENNTKSRVKNVLKFRKPVIWAGMICTGILVVAALLLLSGKEAVPDRKDTQGGSYPLTREEWIQELCDARNPYIGDASADGALLQWISYLFPAGVEGNGSKLQTKEEPYGITAYFIGAPDEEADMEGILYKSGAILLATIENAGSAEVIWTADDGTVTEVQVTREQLETVMGTANLYDMSKTVEAMTEYLEVIDGLLAGPEALE